MQYESSLKGIEAYAKDAIDELDESILDKLRGINPSDSDDEFIRQIEQFLRVKTMFPYEGEDLEADAKHVLVRMVEMLR